MQGYGVLVVHTNVTFQENTAGERGGAVSPPFDLPGIAGWESLIAVSSQFASIPATFGEINLFLKKLMENFQCDVLESSLTFQIWCQNRNR